MRKVIFILVAALAGCSNLTELTVPMVTAESPIIVMDSSKSLSDLSQCLFRTLENAKGWGGITGDLPVITQREFADERQLILRSGSGTSMLIGVITIRGENSLSRITAYHSHGLYIGSIRREEHIEIQRAAVRACA